MTVRLENWSFVMGANTIYAAPEQYFPRLYGEVYGHPDYEDGDPISTSIITGYDEETDEFICRSRRYTLGKVDEEYDKKWDEAWKERNRKLDKIWKDREKKLKEIEDEN